MIPFINANPQFNSYKNQTSTPDPVNPVDNVKYYIKQELVKNWSGMVPNERNNNKMEKTPLAEAGEAASGKTGGIKGAKVEGLGAAALWGKYVLPYPGYVTIRSNYRQVVQSFTLDFLIVYTHWMDFLY